MSRSRRQRLRNRFAMIAMTLLLWSQFVLAAHPGCVEVLASVAATGAAMSETTADGECDHDAVPPELTVCQAHCSQGDLANEIARAPAVPPMLPEPAVPLAALFASPNAGMPMPMAVDRPPPVPWHRPTAHPAALLLI